jgi:hypothetical protein
LDSLLKLTGKKFRGTGNFRPLTGNIAQLYSSGAIASAKRGIRGHRDITINLDYANVCLP